MPLKLSALTADRKTVVVKFDTGSLTLTYRPSAFNALQEARELEDKEKGAHLLSQARSLCELITDWDLTDDAGKPVPVSEDVMASLGLDVTNALMNALLDELLPNRKKAPDSPNGSSPEASSAPARSGT